MSGHLWTIGHSTREFSELLAALRANDITDLMDIRRFPSSRSFPQWNREAIEREVAADIAYRWLPQLGGRRHTPVGVDSPNDGWRVKAFRDYADYMASDEFGEGIDELATLARDGRPAIMCSEAVPWRCHRRLVTDALLVRGIPVTHILSPASTREAALSEHASVDGIQLTYPARP